MNSSTNRADSSDRAPAVLPLARELGEKLGGEPWARQIEQPQPARPPVRVGRADVWPPHVLAEIQRIYSGGDQ